MAAAVDGLPVGEREPMILDTMVSATSADESEPLQGVSLVRKSHQAAQKTYAEIVARVSESV